MSVRDWHRQLRRLLLVQSGKELDPAHLYRVDRRIWDARFRPDPHAAVVFRSRVTERRRLGRRVRSGPEPEHRADQSEQSLGGWLSALLREPDVERRLPG